jgi:hypothetical protein
MAGGLGFEPRLAESESHGFPAGSMCYLSNRRSRLKRDQGLSGILANRSKATRAKKSNHVRRSKATCPGAVCRRRDLPVAPWRYAGRSGHISDQEAGANRRREISMTRRLRVQLRPRGSTFGKPFGNLPSLRPIYRPVADAANSSPSFPASLGTAGSSLRKGSMSASVRCRKVRSPRQRSHNPLTARR